MIAFLLGPAAMALGTIAVRLLASVEVGSRLIEGPMLHRAVKHKRSLNFPSAQVQDLEEQILEHKRKGDAAKVEELTKARNELALLRLRVLTLDKLPVQVKEYEGKYALTDEESKNLYNSYAYDCAKFGVDSAGALLEHICEVTGFDAMRVAQEFMNGRTVDPGFLKRVSDYRFKNVPGLIELEEKKAA